MLENPETFGSVLVTGLTDEFGVEWLSWEPNTILMEIEQKWKSRPPPVNRDKINALAMILTTNMFYRSLEVFIPTCHALNNREATFHTFMPASVSEMSWGLAEVSLLSPPDEWDIFNVEIPQYMLLQLEVEGFSKPPRIMSRYVKMPDVESVVNTNLDPEGIDYKSYWDGQQNKRLEVEEYVKTRMLDLIRTVSAMTLHNSDREGIESLLRRAEITLAGQSQQTAEAKDSVPRKITL